LLLLLVVLPLGLSHWVAVVALVAVAVFVWRVAVPNDDHDRVETQINIIETPPNYKQIEPDDAAVVRALCNCNGIVNMNKTILHWSYLNFKDVPMDLFLYEDLEEVYLKENFISVIPKWLLNITTLKFIHLAGNNLSELPTDIYMLENLEFLDVSNNELKELPPTLGLLLNLQQALCIWLAAMTLNAAKTPKTATTHWGE